MQIKFRGGRGTELKEMIGSMLSFGVTWTQFGSFTKLELKE